MSLIGRGVGVALGVCLLALITPRSLMAFNGERAVAGPLSLSIAPIDNVKEYDAPREVDVQLRNSGDAAIDVALEMKDFVDECHAVGEARQSVSVAAKGSASAKFQFAVGHGAASALYPVHIYANFLDHGTPVQAHAVQIFETQLPQGAAEMQPIVAPRLGCLPLATRHDARVAWQYFDQPLVYEPMGFRGADPVSRASFSQENTTRGETRAAIAMHPPYRPKPGTVFAEFRIKLPDVKPISLSFSNAIRDSAPTEPKSDGVTFRVWADDKKLFERHTDSKVYVPGQADLSEFAGKEILLRLESHPGPKHDTTCDQSFWGDPVISLGEPQVVASPQERKQLGERAIAALAEGHTNDPLVFVWDLEGGCRAALALGRNGLADGALAFGSGEHHVVFDGFDMSIFDQPIGRWPSGVITTGIRVTKHVPEREIFHADGTATPSGLAAHDPAGLLTIHHSLRKDDQDFDLDVNVWAEQGGLRVKITCPQRITDLAPGHADRLAERVYYGHGYCIVEPKAFRAASGGHNLATRHVGFDFEGGLSLLTATDLPIETFEVDPARYIYTVHTHPDATFTFVPGTKGALDCALRYRPLFKDKAADGVALKAGRFVFDYWGSQYADDTAKLNRCFDYGMAGSLLIMHSWQRWGYDYRLPDIYPPDPHLGTLEDMQALAKTCAAHDTLFGLHDNYIDFYPDAQGYSYDHISYNAAGQPKKAWLNHGREAQSYQFRPDHVHQFLQRNLALMKPTLHPTASFVDVFTSIPPFDYYDRQGNFHSRVETLRCWGEAFAEIRNTFGAHAPTSSEAGGDFLIGYLDGADCEFMQLTDHPAEFCNAIPCKDWDRVPWFDAVAHDRFILHGVGYSNRYQGERPRESHGIESDDYINAEVLTGHALMIDLPAGVRGAVRKHWLAQDFIRGLAMDAITNMAFDGTDIHRVIVTWKTGAQVFANRGVTDWTVEGHVLPPYGYFARSGAVESSIERINGAVVEQSRNASGFYVNGRSYEANPRQLVRPAADHVEYLGDRKLKLYVNWDAQRPLPADYAVFVHLQKPHVTRMEKIEANSGGKPNPPTSQWQGRVTTGGDWTIELPPTLQPGTYEVLVGMYDARPGATRGSRVRMLGEEKANNRYLVGNLIVEGAKTKITGVRLGKSPASDPESELPPVNAVATDFPQASTLGAFRCQVEPKRLVVTPLPDGNAFAVRLHLDRILGKAAEADAVHALDATGKAVRTVEFKADGADVTFEADGKEFAYEVSVK